MRLSPATPILKTDTLELLPTPKRIRVMLNGRMVADSRRAAMLHEEGHRPVYYVPIEDVDMTLLTESEQQTHCPRKGDARYWNVTVDGQHAENAAWAYPEPIKGVEPLAGYVAFYRQKMDAFFEEDELLATHPRDPYHRVDTRRSSRHVKVVHAGTVIAESTRPTMLFETDLPTGYYLPAVDVKLEHLEPTRTVSSCPYKGHASYYAIRLGGERFPDVAWTYERPLPEAFDVRGMICFYGEKLDEFYVDGEPLG